MIPERVREALIRAVEPLENIPENEKDWHPGSNDQVLDLVHPSLYPLVFGQTRILPAAILGLSDCLDRYGEGEILAVPSYDEVLDEEADNMNGRAIPRHFRSTLFQWLPSNFEIPRGSNEVK